jgi:hypothetical protein
MGVLGRRGTEGDWRAGRQTDGGKLPQNDIARGCGSAQRIRMEFSRAGWSEISRLWDTGLVHTTSSGLREVPDFIELMSLARQSLPALRAKSIVSSCSGLSDAYSPPPRSTRQWYTGPPRLGLGPDPLKVGLDAKYDWILRQEGRKHCGGGASGDGRWMNSLGIELACIAGKSASENSSLRSGSPDAVRVDR